MDGTQEKQSKNIRDYILDNLEDSPKHITSQAANHFKISRQAAYKHVRYLIEKGLIEFEGKTRSRHYSLKTLVEHSENLIVEGLEEDKVWREHIRPYLNDAPKNIVALCEYGFNEMVNNVIDHSDSESVSVRIIRKASRIELLVWDRGIGIFNKLYKELNLEDPLHAILELAKGKLTTDPEHHTGEGVFFTSRMFDRYSILSGKYYFAHLGKKNEVGGNDWILEDAEEYFEGTGITMNVHPKSSRTTIKVFDYYKSKGDEYGFSKTHVPVVLARYGDENLVSRSQAKRLLARFERFKEILLDFEGVETIGQAFADEIFRVFTKKNPTIKLLPINANEQVTNMIYRAIRND